MPFRNIWLERHAAKTLTTLFFLFSNTSGRKRQVGRQDRFSDKIYIRVLAFFTSKSFKRRAWKLKGGCVPCLQSTTYRPPCPPMAFKTPPNTHFLTVSLNGIHFDVTVTETNRWGNLHWAKATSLPEGLFRKFSLQLILNSSSEQRTFWGLYLVIVTLQSRHWQCEVGRLHSKLESLLFAIASFRGN